MITFEKQRILYGEYMTPHMIDGVIIMFDTPSKGLIRSHICTATISEDEGGEASEKPTYITGSAIQEASRTFPDTDFAGKDILCELHLIYMADLKQYNPDVTFTNTMGE